MMGLSEASVDRAVQLAETELRTPWGWADLALEVAGPVGEQGHSNNGSALLEELVTNARDRVFDPDAVPSVGTLENRRRIASRVPPALRDGLSLTAAEPLAGAEPSEVTRVLEVLVDERKTRERVTYALKLIRLPDDLAEFVRNGRLTMAEAEAALAERDVARHRAVVAYTDACQALTAALSYAISYRPPAPLPDRAVTPTEFIQRAERLIEAAIAWGEEESRDDSQ